MARQKATFNHGLLDNRPLPGVCTLAWAVPYELRLAVAAEYAEHWPEAGMSIPLGRLVLSANDIDLAFHLLQINYWSPSENMRLYQLEVVPAETAS